MSLIVHPRRPRAAIGRMALALVVAVMVNLVIFSCIARLLDEVAPSPLPSLVELGRADPPHAPPLPPVTPPHTAPAAPTTPPTLPTLDLGVLASDHPYAQPDQPVFAALPAIAPALIEGVAVGAGPAQPFGGVLNEGQLDEGVQALNRHEPEFPARAQRLGLTDTVTVSFVVHADGSVSDITMIEARHPEYFGEPSIACVRSTRFSPGRKDGHAVATRCLWTFHYVLPDRH
jgi:periplasmic protein TonB